MRKTFAEKYGPWALVAGASRGVGRQYAFMLASRGLNVALVARNEARLRETASAIRERSHVEIRTISVDLARSESLTQILDATSDIEIGLLVYNAGIPNPGAFLDRPLESHLLQLTVNCAGPLALIHEVGLRMRDRGRGGIILMSSLSGFSGSPLVAGYSASKSFGLVLTEGLAPEFASFGVDVLACAAGVIRDDDGPVSRKRDRWSPFSPPRMDPGRIAGYTLGALGRRSVVVPGMFNALVAFALKRLLPRWMTVRLMARTARELDFPVLE